MCAFRVHAGGREENRIIDVSGELDLASAPELDRLIQSQRPCARLVVDLAECSFADASGVAVLVAAQRAAGGGGPSLVLRSPSPAVRWVLELCNLDHVLAISDDDVNNGLD